MDLVENEKNEVKQLIEQNQYSFLIYKYHIGSFSYQIRKVCLAQLLKFYKIMRLLYNMIKLFSITTNNDLGAIF